MEVDDNQCKFTGLDSTGGQKRKLDETGGDAGDTGGGRFYNWPSSRIVRVSRASGGKDRHSKVLTSKGLRDRRVRLSVNTAIQFYDLQDRLGYDQPSKAVEWLLKAAASSITELPPMTMPFPETPKESSYQQMTKSAGCSSNSENSKGSAVLSLSRSDSRVGTSDKVKEENPISQTTSFTELLSGIGGGSGASNVGNVNNSNAASPNACNGGVNESNYFEKSAPMDYFSGLFGAVTPGVSRSPLFTVEQHHHHHHHQPELQQFSIVPEQLIIPVAARGNHNEYNLNFKISSGSSSGLSSGIPRGTLQSNSSTPSSLFPQFQRFPQLDSSSVPSYYIGTVENHNQFLSQLCFDSQADNNGRQKGKGKN